MPEVIVLRTPRQETVTNLVTYSSPKPFVPPPPPPPPRYYIHDWAPHLKKYRPRWRTRAAAPVRFLRTQRANPGVRDQRRLIRQEHLRRLRAGTSKRR